MPVRDLRSSPVVQLPGLAKPVVAVRWCPVLFSHREPGHAQQLGQGELGQQEQQEQQAQGQRCGPFPALPYRMVLAVATMDSVLLYDTQV